MTYQCLISFSSPTAAEKAVRLLSAHGLQATRIRMPQNLAGEGCAVGVTFSCEDRDAVIRLLEKHSVPYRKFYSSEMRDIF